MGKGKKSEGEMGSGDSDDEFYNVKLPYTPTVAADKPIEKVEVKKIYSPSRTKVKYDYKFDSSSDDESESGSSQKDCKARSREPSDINSGEKSMAKKEEHFKESHNLSLNTYKVVEKINEELKNMKNTNSKAMSDKSENTSASQNHMNASMSGTGNVSRSQIGVVSPVVVVPPPLVVPQAPVMNVGSMIVSPSVNMGRQNILPRHMMSIRGNLLRGPAPMSGLITNPNSAITNSMVGMNAVSGTMAGMMGMQGNIMGLPGNAIAGQGSVMGLQGGMITNPANPTMGGMNMAMQGNMMRMVAGGNGMLHMQRSSGTIMGVQGSNNMMGISRPGNNVMGMTRPMSVSGAAGTMLGVQNSGNGVITNPGGIMVNAGNVMATNPMVGNPGGLMVMGGVMSNISGAPNVVNASQANMISNPGNAMANNNAVRMMGSSQGNATVRPVPPPSFFNIRNRPPAPGNFKWPPNPRMPGSLTNAGLPTTIATTTATTTTGTVVNCTGVPSPASSPADRGNNGHCGGDELSREDKEKSSSDRCSILETDESRSPPRELPNTFKNDGSFMEIFKRMKGEKNQEASSVEKAAESTDSTAAIKKPSSVMLSGIVGKRRGGRVLKTGLVKKVKRESEADGEKHPKDAWSMYMAEVKKYREASCEEEGKTRPLVK